MPDGCNIEGSGTRRLLEIFKKKDITEADINYIKKILIKNNVVNDYGIKDHPAYKDYTETSNVQICKGATPKRVHDFRISEFPDYKNYVKISDLAPPEPVKNRSIGGKSMIAPETGGASFDWGTEAPKKVERKQVPGIGAFVRKIRSGKFSLQDLVTSLYYPQYLKEIKKYMTSRRFTNYNIEGFDSGSKLVSFLQANKGRKGALKYMVDFIKKNHSDLFMIEDVSDYKSYIDLIKKLMTEYGASLNQADIQTLNDEATQLNNNNNNTNMSQDM